MTQREEFEKWFFENGFLKSATIGEKMLMLQAWKAAKAQAVPQWISVSERLPKHGQYVLSASIDGRIYKSMAHITTGGRCIFKCALVVWEHDNVTHWMPLPAAPEQQK